ncbi:MAG: radical SAM protein, partial [Desulfovibrionaceae bacterium]|nr:radical SAM protein [Desulfovibrionaceae bacterium]
MEYEGSVYRPPLEADDILLQVEIGCTHNRCTFCNMFRDKKFRVVDEETIVRNLQEAAQIYRRHQERVFLVDGDAFTLSFSRLKRIAELVHQYLPGCRTITMYAAVRNIKNKTDEQLAELRRLGINDLYVGIESGLDDVLAAVRKGNTVQDADEQLNRLNRAGIRHCMMLMPGLAGRGRGVESGIAAAELANRTRPFLIIPTTASVFPGTELYDQVQRGEFVEAPESENLSELRAFLEHVNLPESYYWAAH